MIVIDVMVTGSRPPQKEYDIFISYSRDTIDTVDSLSSQLENEGLTVFIDQRSIRPGDRWPFEVTSAIKTCKAFVVVLTKRYMRSMYCNGELYEAEALGKRLFPVVCENGWEDVPGAAPVREVVREVRSVSLVVENKETKQILIRSIKGQ